jgi:acyl carrier protein
VAETLDRATIFGLVAEAIHEETGSPAEITEQTASSDVPGWDSLAHVRIVLSIGIKLDREIPIDDTYKAANVGELTDIAVRTARIVPEA